MALDETMLLRQLQCPKTREQAFTQLVSQYKQPLYWQIRRMVLSHDDADDILQNTFIKAWTGLEQFRGDAKISTWLYRIASNETLTFLTRRQPTGTADAAAVAAQLESDPYFDGDETQLQLQQAIASLPARQREVFLLKYYDDMKYEDMSRMLSLSVGALKASYHHAVQKISDFFHSLD